VERRGRVTQENNYVLAMESGDVRIRGVRATEVGLRKAMEGASDYNIFMLRKGLACWRRAL
jgi:hypothetical protein